MVNARVSILASQRVSLRRQTRRILVLKGLPLVGREREAVKERGPRCRPKDSHRAIVRSLVSRSCQRPAAKFHMVDIKRSKTERECDKLE